MFGPEMTLFRSRESPVDPRCCQRRLIGNALLVLDPEQPPQPPWIVGRRSADALPSKTCPRGHPLRPRGFPFGRWPPTARLRRVASPRGEETRVSPPDWGEYRRSRGGGPRALLPRRHAQDAAAVAVLQQHDRLEAVLRSGRQLVEHRTSFPGAQPLELHHHVALHHALAAVVAVLDLDGLLARIV